MPHNDRLADRAATLVRHIARGTTPRCSTVRHVAWGWTLGAGQLGGCSNSHVLVRFTVRIVAIIVAWA